MIDRKGYVEKTIARIEEKATDRQVEAGKRLLAAIYEDDMKSKHWLQEGISTSDVPSLLQPSLNVIFLTQYRDYPTVWQEIAEEFTAPASSIKGGVQWGGFEYDDSALQGDHDGDTFVGMGLPGVGEYDEYPAVSFVSETLSAEVRKGGERVRFSWEAGLATGEFDWIPRATAFFARNASEQEDVALAKQFTAVDGTINTDFTTITANPALTVPGLEAAVGQGAEVTVAGRPLGAQRWRLVVTPALSATAANVLSVTQVQQESTIGGDTYTFNRGTTYGNVGLTVFNALAAVGNYTTPGEINDYWFLVPQGTVRPAFLEVFLRGYRTPLITVKDSGHFTLGGGAVPAREGNFEVDDVETRIRHVVGAAAFATDGVLYSTSAGS